MKEVSLSDAERRSEPDTFAACVAAILEVPLAVVPRRSRQDAARDWGMSRWLGGLGLGLARIADAASFAWAGPWVARVESAAGKQRYSVVMYGVPSGVAWDPSGVTAAEGWAITDGFLIAPADVAQAHLTRPPLPTAAGIVESLWIAPAAGEPAQPVSSVLALAGEGLDGDRHVAGTGTFPSGLAGSALTLIEAEVCDSFTPPLLANEHRRNVLTRGISLNGLVGRDFAIGAIRCRGIRLCEPCRVIAGYAGRPVLRPLIHRGGLRADILDNGTIAVGDPISPVTN